MPADVPSKPCVACGRTITWRKKWERDWENVKFCSDACRRSHKPPKPGRPSLDRQHEVTILTLLAERDPAATGKTSICPSEVARLLRPDDWRPLMEPVRRAARRLVARGEVEITQGGRVVDPSTAKGPIRLRRARRS